MEEAVERESEQSEGGRWLSGLLCFLEGRKRSAWRSRSELILFYD